MVLLGACEDGSQAPPARPEPAVEAHAVEGGNLGPLDLVYVCGTKFLATNSTRAAVHVTWRVAGTRETGSLTLPPGPVEDPGHSETELETKQRGNLELYLDDQRVARRRNEKLPCGPSAQVMASAVAGPAESGSWSAQFPWPVVGLHASLLPDGRVLSWGMAGDPQIWNPSTGNFTPVPSQPELFCAGHSFLPDGRLLVTGGHIASDRGIADVSIFSPATGAWVPSAPMRRGRWYPTNTTLGNGSVVILGGRDEVGDEVAEPEVWSPSGIRLLTGASLVLPYYPRTFVAPNGLIFYAGEQQATKYLNTSGTGSWTSVGNRRYGNRSYGAAVMYDHGKILYVGGGRSTNTAEIINLNSASPTWQWTGSMAFARRNLNATLLPTGEVLVTGGSSAIAFNDVSQAVRAAEIWSPATGVWRTMASNAVRRTYHSTSLLLPDGRVLHMGSGEGSGMPEERNAELFSPPYLAKGARPTITDAPSAVAYGSSFSVTTPQAAGITKVSLIRLGSVTHAFDMNQRFQWLPFVRGTGALTVSAPASGNRAPPGHYMLFVLDGTGVPSVGKIVKVGPTGSPSPSPNLSPAAAFIAGCSGLNCTFADRSTDPDDNLSSWSWNFGDGDRSPTRDANHAFAAAGTYTVTLTAKDTEGATGTATKQVTVPGQQFPIGLTLTTRSNATTQFVDLVWTRGQGPTMYIYRNGLVHSSTGNDGRQTVAKNVTGPATYIFKVCEAATTICSNPATAQFNGGSPPPNAPPNANFTPTCTGRTCRFADGSTDSDGSVTGWQWNFGDGSSATVRNPSHTYASGGDYTVTLTATDNLGSRGSATKKVAVDGPANVPPTANFSSSCTALDCGFTDSSTDSDGSVTGWQWDFGDGSSANVRNPEHSYDGGGTYDVSLTVTDNRGGQASTGKQITVAPAGPNENPAADFSLTCAGLACNFTDGSSDPDGSVTGWQWDFGDGSAANVRNPSHTYADDGTYTVVLTVTDNRGGEGSTSEQVSPTNAPPAADFTSSCNGLTCGFTDASVDGDGSVAGWRWDFGDGSQADVRNPSHTYADEGSYTVALRVTDNAGGEASTSKQVTATPPPPNAPPVADFTSSCTELTCAFTDRSTDADGSVTAWSWSFGDGATSTSRNPSRTYAAAGTYIVTLRVTDNQTATHQRTASVTVTAPPAISLTGTGREDATYQYLALRWSGANGARVDVHQNGRRLPADTPNDGQQTIRRPGTGPATYVMKICETGSTTRCSNNFTLVFD